MPVSQVLNPKGLIKKPTNNDLPFNTTQPVLSSYYATSTAAQTVINLPFSIDTTNTDIFWLFVDGKKLDFGVSNDYIFTSIGSDLTSSQVTLEQALPVNLNIQAYKLGLKKESEFLTDNRFTQLYASSLAGFQGFINPTDNVLTATATTGSPAAGFFYTNIVGRASLIDLSQDMKARMGIERIMTQSCYQLQNEYGPNGEPVWAIPNDTFGQIRLAGTGWLNQQIGTFGQEVASLVVGDFAEITFYGTGLNVLTYGAIASARSCSITVDGVANGTFTQSTASTSPLLGSRNYSPNTIISAIQGLTLGVHTVRLTIVTAIDLLGFEIINTNSSNVVVNAGTGYSQGKKYSSSAASTFAYNSVATGTRGGRVLVYQNGDGTIGKAWQAVNAASALLGLADHTNEEVARTYYPREFGAGRTDDFSRVVGAQAAAFTLDDGTTSLVGTSVGFASVNSAEGVSFGGTGNSITFTFVGTGLDIQASANTLSGYTLTYSVDGSTAAAITFTSNVIQNKTIVSGLPYGSHTFRLSLTAATSGTLTINKFVVYQPKKPALPSGTVEIADYNVLANFSTSTLNDNTINGALQMATGVLYKSISREWLYTGANWSIATSPYPSGFDASTSTNNGQTATYTFFGTGAVLTVENSGGGTFSVQVSVDGSLFSTGTALNNMTNAGGGTYTTTTSTTQIPGRISVSGLTLGVHTITINRSAGTGSFFFDDVQIATPIHSYKSNFYSDLQNTLSVGSQGISDNRKTTPVKDSLPVSKAYAQAIGIQSASTTSTALVPVPDLSVTVKTSGGPLDINFMIFPTWSSITASMNFQLVVDGVAVSQLRSVVSGTSGGVIFCVVDRIILPVSPGAHQVDVYYSVSAGGTNTLETYRSLIAKEV